MFRTGSKIVIVASSKSKGLGPKRGSEGYIGNKLAENIFVEYGFVATIFDVFFTRYGFEKGTRNERKRLLFVYPISKGSSEPVETQIKSMIKRVQSPKSKSMWEEVRHEMSKHSVSPFEPNVTVSNTQIALAVPTLTSTTDLSKVNETELIKIRKEIERLLGKEAPAQQLKERARQDLNLQPSAPKADALSN